MSKAPQVNRSDVLQWFEDTRPIHGGRVNDAAPLLGMTVAALERALYRARKAGLEVSFKGRSTVR